MPHNIKMFAAVKKIIHARTITEHIYNATQLQIGLDL